MIDVIHPISKVSARDILKEIILQDERFRRFPNICDALILADEIRKDRGTYVDPNFLLTVWIETDKLMAGGATHDN